MRGLLALLAVAAALVAPAAAAAHPLGNFTISRSTSIDASGGRVYVHYVLDLAEIPAFQERERLRRPGFAVELAHGLVLRLDGRRAALRLVDRRLRRRPGAGGLETVRFEAVYAADRAGRALVFRDTNFAGRRGWREVVVRASAGAAVLRSDVPSTSRSDDLRAYPEALLGEPPDVTAATATLRMGRGPGTPPDLGRSAPAARASGFEGLVRHDLSPGFVLLSLGLALFWGAAHALGPGHGKAIVAGYLVGTRGTPRHALLLALIVTVTHTSGVLALGLVTLGLSAFVLPEQLYPWLNLVSALLVVGVGLAALRARLAERAHTRAHAHAHARGHHHEHHHEHDADHHGVPGHGVRGLLGVGVSGGILPCPTALVVLLAAISLERVGYGLVLMVAFSLGLAATVTGIGLVAVTAKRVFERASLDGPLIRLLPAASALVVLGLGLVMTFRALPALV